MEKNAENQRGTRGGVEQPANRLQEQSLQERDMYGFNGGDNVRKPGKSDPRNGDGPVDLRTDPYGFHGGDTNRRVSPELRQEVERKMAEYKKELAANNVQIEIGKGEGPWQALTRQKQEAQAKKSGGQELSANDKAILGMTEDQINAECKRMRDRDFKSFAEKGEKRDWYIKGEKSDRWSGQEMEQLAKAQEAKLMAQAEKQQAKLDQEAAKAKAAEAKAREQEEARKLADAQQKQLAEAVDKSIPKVEVIAKAGQAVGLAPEAAPVIRERLAAQIASEVMAGTLRPEALERPVPPIGSVFVATETVSPQELQKTLEEQAQLAKQGQQPPKLGDMLRRKFPDRVARIDATSKFYDELMKLTEPPKQA